MKTSPHIESQSLHILHRKKLGFWGGLNLTVVVICQRIVLHENEFNSSLDASH